MLFMRHLILIPFLALSAHAQSISVPSGQKLDLLEAFWEDGLEDTPALRLRFVAPEISGARTFAEIEPDFHHLCEVVGLGYASEVIGNPLIIVNLSDRPVEFGATDPDAVQYFEAFRIEDGECVWEGI